MGNVVIREGLAEDLETAFAVWRAAETMRRGSLPIQPVTEERVRAYARRSGAFLIVADDEISGVVGMALGTPATSCPAGLCILQMVFVAPGHWGEGIGGRLVDAAVAQARSRGFGRAKLWTHAANSRARRLYEGHGFVDSGCQEIGELGEPIIQYERTLRDS